MKKLLFLLLFISCSNIKEGEIYEKKFKPAYSQLIMLPVVISNGKTTSTMIIPTWYHYPDSYKISIKKYSKKNNEYLTRNVYTSKNVFDEVKLGDWYKICDSDCLDEAPRKKLKRK